MTNKQVSFRIDEEKVEALDRAAAALDRDRSYLINQAVEAYLEVHRWQTEHIRKAKAGADAGGPFISHEDMQAWADSLTWPAKPRRRRTRALAPKRAGREK